MAILFVEDVVQVISASLDDGETYAGLIRGEWYVNFITNMANHVRNKKQLSTEQAKMILKIIEKIKNRIISLGQFKKHEIDDLLKNPIYRKTLYQSSNVPREVRFIGNNILAFRFKYDPLLRRDVKNIKNSYFEPINKLWLVPVTRDTIDAINDLIDDGKFSMDNLTNLYLTECRDGGKDRPSFKIDEETDIIVSKIPNDILISNWIVEVLDGEII